MVLQVPDQEVVRKHRQTNAEMLRCSSNQEASFRGSRNLASKVTREALTASAETLLAFSRTGEHEDSILALQFVFVSTRQMGYTWLHRSHSDQLPVLAVLGSVLVPLLRAFSGTGLRTRFVPSDLFWISGCRIGPVPTCPLFSHFQSPSGTIPIGTTYTTTKPSDIDILAHLKLPSTCSPLQT